MYRTGRAWMTWFCCVLILATTPGSSWAWADANQLKRPEKAEFVSYDVELARGGIFSGKVTDAGGVALVRAPVVLYEGRKEIAKTRSDEKGRFAFEGLRGGAYQLYTVERQGMVRAWAPGTAPPDTSDSLLVTTQYQVVRGQYDLNSVLHSGVIPIIVVTAAAISIPIIVSDKKDRKNSS